MRSFYLIRTDLGAALLSLIKKMKTTNKPGALIPITQEEHEALRTSVRIKKKKLSKRKGVI